MGGGLGMPVKKKRGKLVFVLLLLAGLVIGAYFSPQLTGGKYDVKAMVMGAKGDKGANAEAFQAADFTKVTTDVLTTADGGQPEAHEALAPVLTGEAKRQNTKARTVTGPMRAEALAKLLETKQFGAAWDGNFLQAWRPTKKSPVTVYTSLKSGKFVLATSPAKHGQLLYLLPVSVTTETLANKATASTLKSAAGTVEPGGKIVPAPDQEFIGWVAAAP
jgi:hypothetical protein